MFWEIVRSSPWTFVATVLVPMLGAVGALLAGLGGYENLKHQVNADQQSERIEQGINAIQTKNAALETTVTLLKSYDDKLVASGKRDEILTALINQYQSLLRSAELFGRMTQRDTSQDQGKIALEIMNILNQDVVHTTVRDDLPGRPLIIELAPNSFRVIYAVATRVTPTLRFLGLPQGVSASVSSASEIGFTVSFLPLTISVDRFGFIASAEL